MSSTALGFAAWNMGASRAAGANGESPQSRSTSAGDSDRVFLLCLSIVAGTSIFLIFNGIAVPLFVTMYVCISPRSTISFVHSKGFPTGHWWTLKFCRSPRLRSRSNVFGQGFSLCCKLVEYSPLPSFLRCAH